MSNSKENTRITDFGTKFKNRLAGSFQDWIPQLKGNIQDIWLNPATHLIPEDNPVGVAVAAGPSAERNIHLLKDRDLIVACADRAAATYGHLFRSFYVGTSDPSPLIAKLYKKMPTPIAVLLSVYSHQQAVKVLKDRKIPHYYYTPAFKDDNDEEFKLINKLLLTLTETPLMYGVSDSGSLAFRILVGLGCRVIGLVGLDYSEPYERPIEKWSLYPAYRAWMEAHNIEDIERMKQMMNVRRYTHPIYGNDYVTDVSWDSYRGKFLTLLEIAKKQGIKTINCSEGGSLYTEWLPCQKLEVFLKEQLPSS